MKLPLTNQVSLRGRARLDVCHRMAVLLLMAALPCFGQAAQSQPRGPVNATTSNPQIQAKNEGVAAELTKRARQLETAKASGDSAQVAHASELVIAFVLRQLGQIRLWESSYAQAGELYQRSLNFENVPDVRVDLAVAHLQAGKFDESIADADQALLDDPNNLRGFQVLARDWTAKKDQPGTVRALKRVAELSPTVQNLYALATAQLAASEPEERKGAQETFAQLVKMTGNSGSLHVMFGRAYRDAGDMPAAIREFETAVKLDTRTPHAHYFLGLAQLAQNEWAATPEVRREFQTELQYNPKDYLANYMLGFVLSEDRNYEQANRYLKTASALNDQSPDPWLYLGLNTYAANDMSHAEQYFRTAIELTGSDESRSNYQIRRAYIDLGRILTNSGRKEEGEKYLGKARELQNKVLQSSQRGMAAHYAEQGVDSGVGLVTPPTEADKGILAATDSEANVDPFGPVDPSAFARANLSDVQKKQAQDEEKQLRAVLAQAYSDLATSEAIRKDYASALGHYQEAEHWDAAEPGVMRNLGVAAFRSQAYAEAIRGLSAHLGANPEDEPARAMLGMAYVAQDKYAEAVKTFSPLGKKGMQDAAAGYAWALALTRLGETIRASEVLKEFEKEDRPNETLMLVGQLWLEIGDYGGAYNTFHRVLQNDPAYPKAHFFAGQACIHLEHWPEAAQEFQAELNLTPQDAEAKFNLGFVYLQQSRTDEAAELFEEAIAINPEHSSAHYEYGKILLDRGDLANAVVHLETAARLSPRSDFVHYQLQLAYRKLGRTADAERELEIYKKIKAEHREQASKAISSKTP